MIEFIYFDIGKVLLRFSHEQMFEQMAEVAGVSSAEVRRAMVEDPGAAELFRRVETGQVDEATYYEEFCARIGRRPDRQSLEFAASDIFSPLTETWSLVEKLQAQGMRMGLLSNAGEPHWGFITSGRFSLLASPEGEFSPFEVALSSHLVGAMKPARRIYEVAIERARVSADRIFFTDDRMENVEGAREAGIDAVLFTSAADTENSLRERGLSL